jgi:SWI/SNF-related matrix-associated actin-dependent regulator 1 of chromatin subfamily A
MSNIIIMNLNTLFIPSQAIEQYSLGNHLLTESGKFKMMDNMLPNMKDNDDRVLLFTQFTMVLDVMEQYLKIRGHTYLRLDGSTPVPER